MILMIKVIILVVSIIFSPNITLAKNNDKITVKEIEEILFNWEDTQKGIGFKKLDNEKKSKTFKKRIQTRGVAKCMYEDNKQDTVSQTNCRAKVIRRVFQRSEKFEKKRPGDIFFALDAIEGLVFSWKSRSIFLDSYTNTEKNIDKWMKDKPESVCNYWTKIGNDRYYWCYFFNKRTLKKINKFKKNPSNEKVLGRPLIKYIKSVRMVHDIRKNIGDKNYTLIGDMLNSTVLNVRKNQVIPELKKRRILLKKYSLILSDIKKRLQVDNYKSIEKKVSNLSKTFIKFNSLKNTTDQKIEQIDKALIAISDFNKITQSSILNAKINKKNKEIALSSINIMETLISSISNTIPDEYYTEQQPLSKDLFTENDLDKIENILSSLMIKNKEIKSKKLINSVNLIKETNRSINPFDIIKSLDNLGIKNNLNKTFDQDLVGEIAKQQIKNNIDNEILKEAKNILKKLETDNFSDIAKEVSKIAKEVSSNTTGKTIIKTSTASYPDPKFGGQSLKRLIAISRR